MAPDHAVNSFPKELEDARLVYAVVKDSLDRINFVLLEVVAGLDF
jgi:hypothetical protein